MCQERGSRVVNLLPTGRNTLHSVGTWRSPRAVEAGGLHLPQGQPGPLRASASPPAQGSLGPSRSSPWRSQVLRKVKGDHGHDGVASVHIHPMSGATPWPHCSTAPAKACLPEPWSCRVLNVPCANRVSGDRHHHTSRHRCQRAESNLALVTPAETLVQDSGTCPRDAGGGEPEGRGGRLCHSARRPSSASVHRPVSPSPARRALPAPWGQGRRKPA